MPAEFLYNLTKNLTAHLQHKLCAVLPKESVLRYKNTFESCRFNGSFLFAFAHRKTYSLVCDLWRAEVAKSVDLFETVWYNK